MNKQTHKLKGSVALAQETSQIVEVANRLGIVLPSTHTALFKSVYAKIEEPNGNGIRLAKDAVESSLPGLVGSQVNLEHLGMGFIVGIILDATLNADQEIEVVFTFAKNIYKEDYIRALEKMQEGKLAVSFELMSERDSQEHLSDGTIRLHDVDWQGMGFLIDAEPAYKKARVYEMAEIYKQRANDSLQELVYASKIVKSCDDVMKAYMIDQDGLSMGVTSVSDQHFHVYKLNETGGAGKTIATFGNDEDHVHEVKDGFVLEADGHTHSFMDQVLAEKHVVQESKTNKEENQGGVKIMTEEQKSKVAQLRAELEGYLPENISDDDLLVEAKVEEIRKAKLEKEEAMKRTQEVNQKTETVDDGSKTTNTEVTTVTEVIDWEAKVKVSDAKIVDLEVIVEAQKKELETLKTENEGFKAEAKVREEKAKADQIAKIKADLKDNQFTKEFKDEDFLDEVKVKEAKMLKENADLKAENANLKKSVKKEEVKASESTDVLPTGSEENNEENPRMLIAKMGGKK